MFNLPWYAWLNVLALPGLWVFLMFDCAVQGKPRWFRQFTTVSMVACVVCLFLYWNPALNVLFSPLQYALIVLIAPLTIWLLGTSSLQLLAGLLTGFSGDSDGVKAHPFSGQSGHQFKVDDDDIHLDGGIDKNGGDQRRGESIAALFSRNATLDESVGAVVSLIGAQESVYSTGSLVALQLVQLTAMGLLLLPPLILSLDLIQ